MHTGGLCGTTDRIAGSIGEHHLTKQSTTNLCGYCDRPMTDNARLCWDCVNDRDHGLAVILSRLGHTLTAAQPAGTGPIKVTIPATGGRGISTPWDTPSREQGNLHRMLREHLAKQTKFAAETGTRIQSNGAPAAPADVRAGDHIRAIERALTALIADVHRATGTSPARWTWTAVARWLIGEVGLIRRLESGPAHLVALVGVYRGALLCVDRPRERVLMGACSCGGVFSLLEGDAFVKCGGCGVRESVDDRRVVLREKASEMWMTAREVEHVTSQMGERVPDSTVASWHRRGQIKALDGPPVRYLLGDVLAKVEAREQRLRKRKDAK